jgi:hypothetical protein
LVKIVGHYVRKDKCENVSKTKLLVEQHYYAGIIKMFLGQEVYKLVYDVW